MEIKDVLLSQSRVSERMGTTYTTEIDCCGTPLTITTTGGTITDHLAAVTKAEEECKATCDD